MQVKTAEFVMSNTRVDLCPEPTKPEYAFIGRSNVGKSSLINMITNHKNLAKTSGKPGKTQLINHFIINEEWYLVDLPGYGYAKASKKSRAQWDQFITRYMLERENLLYVFLLIDCRIPAQKIDLEFMEFLGTKGIPFIIVFTKMDKLSGSAFGKNIAAYKKTLLETWDELPIMVFSSATAAKGREEVLDIIEQTNTDFVER
ncbi:ribosome biogenesis GTP-binding protein YihA/YsxC [Acidiluteibacter ferrifornacis]|uniref:Probable GTP-binding protein EngB n=1 Tax=Acidiluteibacter ferrifornacis TaxID=2692424 RepID=A0A6N9NF08_9FLAO|nr:ribosome biogenesis GTP-binding protein YihA/YsxC [Acidiluteibacter ferrifornacis]NBG65218.1 YihA family ribosome biogenesis GTP-binding protein [Acidiluteibacter ferrifornacis]